MDLEIKVLDKLEDIEHSLDDFSSIKRIRELKDKIDNDKELKSLIDTVNKESINIYSNKYKESKIKLYNNSLYSEYNKELSNIRLLQMEINKRLNKLNNSKKCKI